MKRKRLELVLLVNMNRLYAQFISCAHHCSLL